MALPTPVPSLEDIVGVKFRETDSYEAKDLVRDLREFAYQVEQIVKWQQAAILDLDARVTALE